MKKVLVTGANGMLGQDLVPILEDEGFNVIETNRGSLDITNFEMVKEVLTEYNPKIVINCAAYTNVDKAEEEIETAIKVNALGVENLAKICKEKDITLMQISTDYVFNGEKNEPYIPQDSTNPINVYGETKLKGEHAVQKYCEKYYIIRTSWLYGHYGRNFVETMISLAKEPELKIVSDQIGCPTWTIELANAIVKFINQDYAYGIYHICGSGKTSWHGFAKEIFRLTDLKINLGTKTTAEYPRPAKRPLYSVMDNRGMCRNWKVALKDYINLR